MLNNPMLCVCGHFMHADKCDGLRFTDSKGNQCHRSCWCKDPKPAQPEHITADKVFAEYERLRMEVQKAFVGKTIRILSNFNDQHYGTSKPSQRGKTTTIISAIITTDGIQALGQGYRYYIPINQLEFVDAEALQ